MQKDFLSKAKKKKKHKETEKAYMADLQECPTHGKFTLLCTRPQQERS